MGESSLSDVLSVAHSVYKVKLHLKIAFRHHSLSLNHHKLMHCLSFPLVISVFRVWYSDFNFYFFNTATGGPNSEI